MSHQMIKLNSFNWRNMHLVRVSASCLNCKLGEYKESEGRDEPPSSEYDCGAYNILEKDIQQEMMEAEPTMQWMEDMATRCGQYQPSMLHKCINCGQIIHAAAHQWPLWAPVPYWDVEPVCSTQCLVEAVARYEYEEDKERAYEQELYDQR